VKIFNVCNVFLNSRRWFVLCMIYISYLVLVLVSGDRCVRVFNGIQGKIIHYHIIDL
jgi:hypothetical protein